jgi:hypothetical protein
MMFGKPLNLIVRIAFGIVSAIGVVIVSLILLKDDRSSADDAALSLLLFIFSITASWIFSKMYSESSASESLRDYGVQVARGLMVLQSQIRSLSRWVSEKRQDLPPDLLNGKIEAQLEHIEEALKGFQSQADATLRGIAGVIGDAFKQYEDTIDQINEIRKIESEERGKLIDQAKSIKSVNEDGIRILEIEENLRSSLSKLEERTNIKIAEIASSSSLPIDIQRTEQRIEVRCPVCAHINFVNIVLDPGFTRTKVCPSCNSLFNVHVDRSGNDFVRLLERGYSQRDTLPSPTPNTSADVPFVLSCVKKRYEQRDFFRLATEVFLQMERIIRTNDVININEFTKEVGKRLQTEDPLRFSNKKVSDFIQMLYWGRFFKFDGMPSFSTAIMPEKIALKDVVASFFGAVGYNFAKTGYAIDRERELSVIRAFGEGLSAEEAMEIFNHFEAQFAQQRESEINLS